MCQKERMTNKINLKENKLKTLQIKSENGNKQKIKISRSDESEKKKTLKMDRKCVEK